MNVTLTPLAIIFYWSLWRVQMFAFARLYQWYKDWFIEKVTKHSSVLLLYLVTFSMNQSLYIVFCFRYFSDCIFSELDCWISIGDRFWLGFPRDGTSRDKPGREVPLSFCPGTKTNFLSRCPFAPGQGQEQMSWDKNLCPGTNFKKMTRFPVLERHFPVLEHPFLLCSVPVFGYQGPSHPEPLTRFLACPVVPLSRDNEGTSVPLSHKVAMSHPVWNPSFDTGQQRPVHSIYDVICLDRPKLCWLYIHGSASKSWKNK